jgi:hypothetical protein
VTNDPLRELSKEQETGKFWTPCATFRKEISRAVESFLPNTTYLEQDAGCKVFEYKYWLGDIGVPKHQIAAEIIKNLILNEIFNVEDHIIDLMMNLPGFICHGHEIERAMATCRLAKPIVRDVSETVARFFRLPS